MFCIVLEFILLVLNVVLLAATFCIGLLKAKKTESKVKHKIPLLNFSWVREPQESPSTLPDPNPVTNNNGNRRKRKQVAPKKRKENDIDCSASIE